MAVPSLPDRFDLWVRRAREASDPARQVDLVLGGLMSLRAVHFLTIGAQEAPVIARVEIEGESCALAGTDADRLAEAVPAGMASRPATVALAPGDALSWCVENGAGLLLNPGPDAVLVPLAQLIAFLAEWTIRPARPGFWIPHLTTQEEDFWQEHGL